MASNLTRKELLKQDKFAVEVEQTVDFFSAHRSEVLRYGVIALAAVVIVAGIFYYRSSQHSVRQQALGEAMTLAGAPVGQPQPGGGPNFPTTEAKEAAVAKALTGVTTDYSGSEEAYVAEFYLAAKATDAGKLDDARKKYQDVADHANANYASLAKLALAQIAVSENKTSEAETLLKGLMDNPTDLVSKTQATISYAKVIGPSKPDEARKLLLQIEGEKSDASAVAVAALGELPQK